MMRRCLAVALVLGLALTCAATASAREILYGAGT